VTQQTDPSHAIEDSIISCKGLPAPINCDYLRTQALKTITLLSAHFRLIKFRGVQIPVPISILHFALTRKARIFQKSNYSVWHIMAARINICTGYPNHSRNGFAGNLNTEIPLDNLVFQIMGTVYITTVVHG